MSRFSVVPAAYLLLLRGEGPATEVLLQLRGPGVPFMAGHWASAAAGHVEEGESLFAAAAREASEELGIGVDEGALTPLCAMHRTMPGVLDPIEQRVDLFLTCRRWSGEPAIQEPTKCSELRWARLDDLPSPVVPHEARVLGLLATGSVPALLAHGFEAG